MQSHAQKGAPAKKSQAPQLEDLVNFVVYRAATSPENVRSDIRDAALSGVPKKREAVALRELFPGFLEGAAEQSASGGFARRKKISELRDFLMDPEGFSDPETKENEFRLAFKTKEDMGLFYDFMRQCGILRNVSGSYVEAEGDYPFEIAISAKKGENVSLRKGHMEAAVLLKEGQGVDSSHHAEADGWKEALETEDPLHGMPDSAIARSVPVRREVNAKEKMALGNEPLPQAVIDSDGDPVPLLAKEIRKEVENAIDKGAKYTFRVRGNARVGVFRNEESLRRHGIDPDRVSTVQKGSREWEVTINGELKPEERDKREFERIARELTKGGRKRRPEGGS